MTLGGRRPWQDVLRFSSVKANQSLVRRHYIKYRQEHGLPDRCDNPNCRFHTDALMWNGVRLRPILDHVDGVSKNNRPENLRHLCPNCDSQLPTRGGANKGRVRVSEGGFRILSQDGGWNHTVEIQPDHLQLTGSALIPSISESEGAPSAPPAPPHARPVGAREAEAARLDVGWAIDVLHHWPRDRPERHRPADSVAVAR